MTESAEAEALSDESGSLSRTYAFMFLHFYQDVLSTVTISHCPMVPSCSNYSVQAVKKHGVLVGIMLTADRLYHEGSSAQFTDILWVEGKPRFVDPVENNDFWWYEGIPE